MKLLKKLLISIKLRLLERKKQTLNQREIALSMIEIIDPYLYSGEIKNGYVNVMFGSLPELTRRIQEINAVIRTGGIIKPDWNIDIEIFSLSLDAYISTENGYYTDPFKSLVDFKKEAGELCILLEPSDTAEYGEDEHNKRMLIKLIQHLIYISEHLLK